MSTTKDISDNALDIWVAAYTTLHPMLASPDDTCRFWLRDSNELPPFGWYHGMAETTPDTLFVVIQDDWRVQDWVSNRNAYCQLSMLIQKVLASDS